MIIDHVNNNSLDNRLVNLREANPTQNNENKIICKNNKSGYKGVYWKVKINKFCSSIKVNKKSIFLGYFDDPKDAYKAYCVAAIKYFGEFKNIEMDI